MYSQKRFTFFAIILLYLQQPTVPSLPEKRRCIWVFTALSAHVQFNILRTDGATKLWGRRWEGDKEKYKLQIMSEKKSYC